MVVTDFFVLCASTTMEKILMCCLNKKYFSFHSSFACSICVLFACVIVFFLKSILFTLFGEHDSDDVNST